MKNNLKTVNIVFSGRMPFKHKLREDETNKILMKSKLGWQLINEEMSPIIRRYVEKKGITVHNKKKNSHISIWTSGAIVITGVTSRKEKDILYDETIKDIRKLCPRVFK